MENNALFMLLLVELSFVLTALQESCDKACYYFNYQWSKNDLISCKLFTKILLVPKSKDNIEKTSNKNIVNMINDRSFSGFYRPRSALARALYEKQCNDRELGQIDKRQWYRVDATQLDEELSQKFVELDPDKETQDFLAIAVEKSSWIWTQIWYTLAKAFLKFFWTITDINGWLGRGSMFVLSEDHMRKLLDKARGVPRSYPHGRMVDLGAGDGEVSRRFAGLFQEIYATEISNNMRNILETKGFVTLDTEEWWREGSFDCICMLNLLDRCSRPVSMVQQARRALAADGLLVVALVLPYKPYVEVNASHKPEERLPLESTGFEQQARAFVRWLSAAGFELRAWARVPYLCEGDFSQAYYFLDDSVYVFAPTPDPS